MKPLRYSAIDTSYTCPQLYKLKYVDGLTFPESNSFDAEFGTGIHLALQAHWAGENAVDTFNMYWNMHKDADLVRFRFDWKYLADAGPVMLDKWLKFHAKKYKPVSVEVELKAKIGKYDFTGTPDFVGEYNGIPSIVDYKAYSKEISLHHLLSNEQMYIYAEMARQTLGYEVKQIAYVGFIKPEKRVQSNRRLLLTQEKLSSMLLNVEHVATDLMTRKVFPKNRKSCAGYGPTGCEAFALCYPGEVLTKETNDE